ncbi:hypothetical protein EXN22_16575 [Pseudomonas tructae]|uniref:Transmembrane protein n=1 Tax=Pseudomonas tructae TaxID=2518644 RepID=A0A411MK91_9PSED|nr:hypothetical protein [Pseudomonas tructae]QBF27223.1 hypothetical protein EXN22_16575 [Pseudomonas tructae]
MMTTSQTHMSTLAEAHNRCGVSWAAVFAGAAGAAALSLILVLLGFGLGFSAVSPWVGDGMSAKSLGISTIVWLALTQIVASGLGGYLAGRLRVKWASVQGDEVYFRDTAHGFLAWAVATLVTATLVVGSVSSIVGGGVQAGAQVAAGAASGVTSAAATAVGRSDSDPYGYFVDSLFRGDNSVAVNEGAAQGVVSRIMTRSLRNGGQLSGEDRQYLAQLISQRSNLTPAQAEQRVDEVFAQARQSMEDAKRAAREAADAASKAAALSALWMFIALLCGAFFASLAATYGGRRRDAVIVIDDAINAHVR